MDADHFGAGDLNDVERMRQVFGKKMRAPSSGTVTSIQGGQIAVRTSKGALLTAAAGANVYRQGDRVTLRNGIVVDKITNIEGKTVYVV